MSPTWLDDPDTEVAPEVLDGWLEEAVGGPLRGRQGGHRVRDLDRGVTYPSVRAAGRELGGVAARLSMALSRHGGFATVDGHHLCFAEHYEALGSAAALARCPRPRERRGHGGQAAGRESKDMRDYGEDKCGLEGRDAGGVVPTWSAPMCPGVSDDATASRVEAMHGLASAVVEAVKDLPAGEPAVRTYRAPGDRTAVEFSCMRSEMPDGFETTCAYLDVSDTAAGRSEAFSSAGRLGPGTRDLAEFSDDEHEAALKLTRAGQNAWADAHAKGLVAEGPQDLLPMRVADWIMDENDGLVTRREAMGIAAEDLSRDPKGLAGRIAEAARDEGLAPAYREELGRLAEDVSAHEGSTGRPAPSGAGSEGRGREAEAPELPGGRG